MGLSSTGGVRVVIFLGILAVSGCGWLTRSSSHEDEVEAQQDDPQAAVAQDKTKAVLDRNLILETQIAELRMEVKQLEDRLAVSEKGKPEPVESKLTSHAGKPVLPKANHPARGLPDSSLPSDEAIQTFQKAKILFDSERYPDAVNAFSEFLREHPDHPFAGAAQYHVGESRYQQNEWKEALDQYRQLLVSYDRSSYVPEALERIAEIEETQGHKEKATESRHLLTSLYPMSAPAHRLQSNKPILKKSGHKPELKSSPKVSVHDEPPIEVAPAIEPDAPEPKKESSIFVPRPNTTLLDEPPAAGGDE